MRSRHSVALQTSPAVFADAETLLTAVLRGECALRRAEGVRMAYIEGTMFIDGEVSTQLSLIMTTCQCKVDHISLLCFSLVSF